MPEINNSSQIEWSESAGELTATIVSGSVDTADVANNAIENTKLADVSTSTIKGRATAGTGDPEDLTASQVRTILNVADGATANTGTVTSVATGSGLTGGTITTTGTLSHATPSPVATDSNNSNGTVIQDLTFDSFGHTASVGTTNLDLRYLQSLPAGSIKQIVHGSTSTEVSTSSTTYTSTGLSASIFASSVSSTILIFFSQSWWMEFGGDTGGIDFALYASGSKIYEYLVGDFFSISLGGASSAAIIRSGIASGTVSHTAGTKALLTYELRAKATSGTPGPQMKFQLGGNSDSGITLMEVAL